MSDSVKEMREDVKATKDTIGAVLDLARWGCVAATATESVRALMTLSGKNYKGGAKLATLIFGMCVADAIVKTPRLIAFIEAKASEIKDKYVEVDDEEDKEESDGE